MSHSYPTITRFLYALLAWTFVLSQFGRGAQVDEAPGAIDPPPVRCLAFSPDGSLLAAAAADQTSRGELVIWKVAGWQEKLRLSEAVGFPRLAFSPNGKLLALSRFAPETHLIEVETGRLIGRLEGHTDHARCVAFTPDATKIITGSYDRTIRIWDAATGQTKATLRGHAQRVYHVAVSPDGSLLASVDGGARVVHLWDLQTLKQIHTFEQFGSHVPQASFSPDGQLLAVASWSGELSLFETKTHIRRKRIRPIGGVHWAEFSPDGQLLGVVTNGTRVYVFPGHRTADAKTKEKVTELLARFEDDSYEVRERASLELRAMGPAAEGQLREATVSTSPEVRWRSRRLLQHLSSADSAVQLQGHQDELECVCFSPDGTLMASGDKGGRVKVWRVGPWTQVASLSIGTGQPD